jgi:phosphotransferase system enzyme I (PtsI)
MDIRHGIAVSPGIAIGPAFVLTTDGVRIPRKMVPQAAIAGEVIRLHEALTAAAFEARTRQNELAARHGKNIGNIFGSHAFLLEDPTLRYDIETLIRAESYSAEYAVGRHLRNKLKELDDATALAGDWATRLKADVIDLEKQLLNHLLGDRRETLGGITTPVIVIADDLTPSETAQLDTRMVHAFVTESGGPTSHTAILAGALEIPAVVGLSKLLNNVSGGDVVIVDGENGYVIVDPDAATLAKYEELKRKHVKSADRYESIKDAEPVTRDGVRMELLGNIEFPAEAAHCLDRGAAGVGLYRTEFLYVNKTVDPTEEEHFQAYKDVATAMGPKRPVVIRTLDIGADKFNEAQGLAPEKNPFLGLRSVRFCLTNKPLFKTQLKAILRASVYGDVRIMFPMISTVLELRQCASLLKEVQEDLDEAGIESRRDVKIGTMIEVPSAAIMADVLAKEVDFFSIGTNDLVQYTLAADRNNDNVSGLYNPVDPAVLRLIQHVAKAGRDNEVEVNVCGEMSGEPVYIPLLMGLGLRTLSATPRKIPELKRVIRSLTVSDCERVAAEALRLQTAREVSAYLREQLRRFLPEAVV